MTLANWTYAAATAPDKLGNTDYLELRESGKEAYATGNSSANRVFMVDWINRPNFLNDLLGYASLQAVAGQTPGWTISRVLPDEHPEIANFFAQDATVDGMGVLGKADSGFLSWTNAKIGTTYKPCDYNILEDHEITTELDRFVSRHYGFSADYLTINGQMKFVSNRAVLTNPPGQVIGAMQLNYTWHEVPGKTANPFQPPNIVAIQNCLGKVNSVAFDVDAGNFPAQTVLFIGVDPKMVTPKLTDEVFYWEITFNFLVRNNGPTVIPDGSNSPPTLIAGHNFIYNVPLAKWDLVTHNGTFGGNRIYQTADLNTLFTIDP